MALALTQPLKEISSKNISWGWGWGLRQPVRTADNLNTSMCRLSWNLGALTSWNPQGLSRPVMGSLYLFISNGAFRNVFLPNFICVFCLPFLVAHSAPCSFLHFNAFTVTRPVIRSQCSRCSPTSLLSCLCTLFLTSLLFVLSSE